MSSKLGGSTAAAVARKEGISVEALPQELAVIDCEKRRGVSRYYAYVIQITRKNREIYYVYRRYRQFHKMTQRLEERFPVEAGSIRASDRVIPLLPGKKYIGRSAVRDVAELRLPYLDEFLKKLYAMSDKLRYDSIVLGFLKPNHEDLNRPYKPGLGYPVVRTSSGNDDSTLPNKSKPPRPTLRPTLSGSSVVPSVTVTYSPGAVKKPSKPPPPRPTPPHKPPPTVANKGPRAKALYNYTAHYDDELSLKEGCTVMLLKKLEGNWYEGKVSGRVGLVPGNYLDIIESLHEEEEEQSSEETDEWDDESNGKITYHYKKRKMTLEVDYELIKRPTYNKLLYALRGQLKDSRIVINYKDKSGDLIEVVDDSDLILMKDNCHLTTIHQQSSDTAPWTLYITSTGDISVYNTKRPV